MGIITDDVYDRKVKECDRLRAALKLALPYVQKEAAILPFQYYIGSVCMELRHTQATRDVEVIRAVLGGHRHV